MARDRKGLYDLLALAREYWLGRMVLLEEHEENDSAHPDAHLVKEVINEMLDGLLSAAAVGDFRLAASFADVSTEKLRETLLEGELWLAELDELPWEAFSEVADLAYRIDGLLFLLERNNKALARGCREDLDGLLVLADWCEESGLPASAAEARYLHGLVRHFRAPLRSQSPPLLMWLVEGVAPEWE